MLRHLVPKTPGLIAVAASVFVTASVVGAWLATAHLPVLAQASIRFSEGDEIERLLKEDVTAGGSVGAPVVASGGTGTLAYSLSGTDAASFSINAGTGQIVLSRGASLNYESEKTTYKLVVTATDRAGQTASVEVTVVIEDVNEPPGFDVGSILFESFEVKENAPANTNIGDPITAADPENDDVIYSLSGASAGLFAVDASSGQIRSRSPMNYEAASSHEIRFIASDPDGSGSDFGVDLTIKVTDVDTEAPGAPSKPSVSPDADDGHEALSVTWTAPENAGPPVSSSVVRYRIDGSGDEWKRVTVGGDTTRTTISGLETDTAYEAQVRAINDEGEGKWSESGKGRTYAARPVNAPPKFDDSPVTALLVAESAQPGSAVGAPFAAVDPDSGDNLAYSLAGVDSGHFAVDVSTGQIRTGPGAALDYETPADSDDDNVYELTVRVSDGSDESGNPDSSVDDSVDLTIRVMDVNEPPVITSSADPLQVDENSAASLTPLIAVDPEGRAVTWSLDPTSPDGGSFSLSKTGAIDFKSAPNYESPSDTDHNNDYELVLVATDDGQPAASARTSLTIRVVNVDEAGTVSLSTLGPQLGVEVSASLVDPDGGVTGASWQWIRYSGDAERAIAGATDASYTPTAADDGSRLQATVNYVDRQGPGKYAAGPLTHPVGDDSNSPPEFSAAGSVTLQVAENTPPDANLGDPVTATDPDGDELVYSLSGVDAGAFDIDRTSGQIKTKDPLDHERRPRYRFTVAAADPGGRTASVQVTVTVTDVETEAPGRPDAPSVGPNRVDPINSIDIEWSPPKNTGPEVSSYEVQYRLAQSGDDWSRVTKAGSAVRATISGLEADASYEAQVRAFNAEGTGAWSASGVGSTLASLPVNTPPEFDITVTSSLSVDENVPAGTPVGGPIRATDIEDDELAYSLAGADAGAFAVNPSTGQIITAAGFAFDFETPADSDGDNTYQLKVRVTDGQDGNGNADDSVDDEIDVAVMVANVNEPPKFPSLTVVLEIDENASLRTNVGGPIVATDPDSDGLTYSLVGAGAGSFTIDNTTGQIMTVQALDYETRTAYELTAIAADSGNLRAEVSVLVRVLNVNEAPVVETAMLDLTLVESYGAVRFDVSPYFNDPDGDQLVFGVSSSDSGVIRVGLIGAILTLTPNEIGSATIEVTAADTDGLSIEQRFDAEVVTSPEDSGGGAPVFPLPPQETGDPSDSGFDQANLLSESRVIVVPNSVSLAPSQDVVLETIAFNQLGDPLPASAERVVCTWSSDAVGSFTPNGTEAACTTTFTAPAEGSGTITVRVTQDAVSATGTGKFEVTAGAFTAPGVVEEDVPEIPFPAGVTGTAVSRASGASITSPGGLSMNIPPGAIDDDFLGAYVEEVSPSEIDVPAGAAFTIGSHAGNFVFTDLEGDPMPGFRTRLPVRICLPITREESDTAAGDGNRGVYVVHLTRDGRFIRHPTDYDVAKMKVCTNVDRFSFYFVGLAPSSRAPTPEPTPTPSQTPAPVSSATQTPTGTPPPDTAPEPTPTRSAGWDVSPGPTPSPVNDGDATPSTTPVLPHTGDAVPGPRLLLIAALAAAVVLTLGLTMRMWSRLRP